VLEHVGDLGARERGQRRPALGAQAAQCPEGVDQRRSEGVAGTDRVRHLHRLGLDLDRPLAVQPECAVGAPRDHDGGRAERQQRGGGVGVRPAGVERLEVLVAGLDQVRHRDHALDPGHHVGAGAGHRRAGVDVVGHGRPVPQAGEQREHVVGAGEQHRAERAGVRDQRVLVAGDRQQPPVDVEGVRRRTLGSQRGLSRRGVVDGRGIAGQRDPGPLEVGGDHLAVVVAREGGGQSGRPAEPGQGDSHVGGAPTGVLVEVAAQRAHDIDHRLPHHQHAALHGPSLPRGMIAACPAHARRATGSSA